MSQFLLVLNAGNEVMIHSINNDPSNPQQPIHSLRKMHQSEFRSWWIPWDFPPIFPEKTPRTACRARWWFSWSRCNVQWLWTSCWCGIRLGRIGSERKNMTSIEAGRNYVKLWKWEKNYIDFWISVDMEGTYFMKIWKLTPWRIGWFDKNAMKVTGVTQFYSGILIKLRLQSYSPLVWLSLQTHGSHGAPRLLGFGTLITMVIFI